MEQGVWSNSLKQVEKVGLFVINISQALKLIHTNPA